MRVEKFLSTQHLRRTTERNHEQNRKMKVFKSVNVVIYILLTLLIKEDIHQVGKCFLKLLTINFCLTSMGEWPQGTRGSRRQIDSTVYAHRFKNFYSAILFMVSHSLWSFSNVELTRTFPLASQLVWTLYYSVHKVENTVWCFLCTMIAIRYN